MLIQAVKQENHLTGCSLSRPSIPLSCPCHSVHAPASLFPLPWLPTTLHLCCALPPSNFLVSFHSSHLPPRPTPLTVSLPFHSVSPSNVAALLPFLSRSPTVGKQLIMAGGGRAVWRSRSRHQRGGWKRWALGYSWVSESVACHGSS